MSCWALAATISAAEALAAIGTSYNAATTRLDSGRLRTEFHGKWINYLDESGEWRPIDPKFVSTASGFEMTAAPFSVVAPPFADEPAVFHNDNRYDILSESVLDEAPLEQTIQAMGAAHVAGQVETGDLGWGPVQHVVYRDAYPQLGADLIYWVHDGAMPRLRKLVRLNRRPASDVSLQFRVVYGELVQVVNSGRNVTIARDLAASRRGNGWANFYAWDSRGAGTLRRAIRFDFEPEHVGSSDASSGRHFVMTKHIDAGYFEEAVLPVFTDATATFYPDPDPETTTVDGWIRRHSVSESWATIHGTPDGTSVGESLGTTENYCVITTASASNQFDSLWRFYTLFDTSSIPDDAVILSATYRLRIAGKADELGGGHEVALVNVAPASNTALAESDYTDGVECGTVQQAANVSIASMPLSDADWTLNPTGLSNISKTGVSKFGVRIERDRANSAPPWGLNQVVRIYGSHANAPGTTEDPRLIVEYGPPPPTVTAIDPSSGVNDASVGINSVSGTSFRLGWEREAGLVGNWTMNESSGAVVGDVSGGGFDGAAVGASIVSGRIGNARGFNGSTDVVIIGDVGDFNYNDTFSVAAWFKSTRATWDVIVSKRAQSDPDYRGFEIIKTGDGTNRIEVSMAHCSNGGVCGAQRKIIRTGDAGGLSDGNWHHVVVTYDGSTSASGMKIYVDGVRTSEITGADTLGSNVTTTSAPLTFGARDTAAAHPLQGAVDEVRVYGVVLDDAEIAELYSATQYGEVRLTKVGESDIVCTEFTMTSSTMLTGGNCDVSGAATGLWDVEVTNPDGLAGALAEGFEVVPACDPATVDVDPIGETYCVGSAAVLTVSATGTEPLSFQWRRDGGDLSDGGNIGGATTETLTIDPIELGDAGDYAVLVTNSCGTALSTTATVVVFGGADCNTNGTPDECDIDNGDSLDCNGSGTPDECDIADGASYDCTQDGVPDECEEMPATLTWVGQDGDDFGADDHWSPANAPSIFRDLILSNQTAEESRCVGVNGGARTVLVEGPGGGRQILEMCCDNNELHACGGVTIGDGGVVEMRRTWLRGGVIQIDGGELNGNGGVLASVVNGGLIAARPGDAMILRFGGESFANEAAGTAQSAVGSLLLVESPSVTQAGEIDVRSFSAVVFNEPLVNADGGVISLFGGTLEADGLTNDTGAAIYGTCTFDTDIANFGTMTIIADTLVVGNLDNEGTVFIQNGILTVTGGISGSGTILGGVGG